MSRLATAILMPALLLATGCQTLNGAVDGLERDVDQLAAAVDRWGDAFLPTAGVGPQAYEPTHFKLPDDPKPGHGYARRTTHLRR